MWAGIFRVTLLISKRNLFGSRTFSRKITLLQAVRYSCKPVCAKRLKEVTGLSPRLFLDSFWMDHTLRCANLDPKTSPCLEGPRPTSARTETHTLLDTGVRFKDRTSKLAVLEAYRLNLLSRKFLHYLFQSTPVIPPGIGSY